jgi:LAO/AO transport system kinase
VLRCVATTGEGVDELVHTVEEHRAFQEGHALLEDRRRRRRRAEILRLVELRARDQALDAVARSGRLDELADQVYRGTLDPYAAADQILRASTLSPQSTQSEAE